MLAVAFGLGLGTVAGLSVSMHGTAARPFARRGLGDLFLLCSMRISWASW